ncbi:monocarboxylate transporter 3-like [Ptychodera flava]|uniref:monocarboxylate transporter 3-like n=1 Tax=Ptychodera flava TaxID=63121 RepID=UPI003969FFE4
MPEILLCACSGSLTGFGPFVVSLKEHFSTGVGKVAGISGTALFVTLATGPISSALNSYLGCRVVVISGGIIATLGTVGSSFATQLSHLYIAYGVVTGFGYGLVATLSVAFIARYFKRRYALANGIVFSAFAVGWIALPQLYQIFIDRFGWRNAMRFLAALNFQICISGAFFRPPPQKKLLDQEGDRATATLEFSRVFEQMVNNSPHVPSIGFEINHRGYTCENANNQRRKLLFNMQSLQTFKRSKVFKILSKIIDFTLFCNPKFVLMTVAYFTIAIGFYPTILFLVARVESFGVPYPLPTTLMTVTGAISLVGRAGHGFLIDVGLTTPVRATALGLFLCGLVDIVSIFIERYIGLACLYGIFGLANGLYHPLLAVTLKDFVGVKKFPAALGFCNLCHGIGALVGPPIAGEE